MERLNKGAIFPLVDRTVVPWERRPSYYSLNETAVGGIPPASLLIRFSADWMLKNPRGVQTVVEKNLKPQHPQTPRVCKGLFQSNHMGIGRQQLQDRGSNGISWDHNERNCNRKDQTLPLRRSLVSEETGTEGRGYAASGETT